MSYCHVTSASLCKFSVSELSDRDVCDQSVVDLAAPYAPPPMSVSAAFCPPCPTLNL